LYEKEMLFHHCPNNFGYKSRNAPTNFSKDELAIPNGPLFAWLAMNALGVLLYWWFKHKKNINFSNICLLNNPK
jgi:hypothetical protein